MKGTPKTHSFISNRTKLQILVWLVSRCSQFHLFYLIITLRNNSSSNKKIQKIIQDFVRLSRQSQTKMFQKHKNPENLLLIFQFTSKKL